MGKVGTSLYEPRCAGAPRRDLGCPESTVHNGFFSFKSPDSALPVRLVAELWGRHSTGYWFCLPQASLSRERS